MQPTTAATPPTTARGPALRVVLFGMPDAGKSSILGALSQAAQTQEHLLNGHLTPLSEGLAELQQRLYDGTPRQTVEEVIPFRIVFEPFAGPDGKVVGPLEAVLIDCDGRVANDLLARRRTLQPQGLEGTLAHAIAAADALVLVVDASARPNQVNADFAEFARFLRLLEFSRGQEAEVSGLPVFLVLTKCDLLAKAGDTLGSWMERIELHKNKVAQRFQDFLAEKAEDEHIPFGKIDLHVWATAVKRPALADSPPRPREPYGVAELFRQALEYSRYFRDHRLQASRRLFWTVAGSLGLLALMGVLAVVVLLAGHRPEPGALERDIHRFEMREQELAAPDRYRKFQAQIIELTGFHNHSGFAALPADRQKYVEDRLKELKAYKTLHDHMDLIPDPTEVRTEAQAVQLRADLDQVDVPEEYRDEWAKTAAGSLLDTYRKDVNAILTAAETLKAGYQQLIRDGQKVIDTEAQADLPRRAKAVVDRARGLPDPKADAAKFLPGSERVPYSTVLSFPEIESPWRRWIKIKEVLEPYAKRG